VPFDSAQLRKHGTFFNTQLFVHSLSVLNDQYVLVADVYQSVQFIRWVGVQRSMGSLAAIIFVFYVLLQHNGHDDHD
jgi:hypothetical protein